MTTTQQPARKIANPHFHPYASKRDASGQVIATTCGKCGCGASGNEHKRFVKPGTWLWTGDRRNGDMTRTQVQ